ncbi:hypothetical protein [Haliovirga abyssi]|uniref:Lipoprotein n=1 Tax=Haliovirga abyssi TaxID=2996794 RepID=A0AAU9DBW8_9FUSO|nr:hypothetical protein [Haliovirga abyssi]BDU49772.1 hypothetical protein HLVA_03410 [Haliovirga abyssi]
MKKLVSAILLGVMLLTTGCFSEATKEEDSSEAVQETHLQNSEPKEVVLNFNQEDSTKISNMMEENKDIFSLVEGIRNEGILSENATIGYVEDAILSFKGVEDEFNISFDNGGNIYNSLKRGVKRVGNSDVNLEDMKNQIKTKLLPKLDTAISKLKLAVEENQIIVIKIGEGSSSKVKIYPAHILMLQSILRGYKGLLEYICAYDLNITEDQMSEFMNKMKNIPTDKVVRVGDYIFNNLPSNLLNITDKSYILKSKESFNTAFNEFLEAIDNIPTGDLWKIDLATGKLDINENHVFSEGENMAVLPLNLINEIKSTVKEMKAVITGKTTVNIIGVKIDMDLSVIFKSDFAVKDIIKRVSNYFAYTNNVNDQNTEALATETLGGVFPNGLKAVVEKILLKINDPNSGDPTNWEQFTERINADCINPNNSKDTADLSSGKYELSDVKKGDIFKIKGVAENEKYKIYVKEKNVSYSLKIEFYNKNVIKLNDYTWFDESYGYNYDYYYHEINEFSKIGYLKIGDLNMYDSNSVTLIIEKM